MLQGEFVSKPTPQAISPCRNLAQPCLSHAEFGSDAPTPGSALPEEKTKYYFPPGMKSRASELGIGLSALLGTV